MLWIERQTDGRIDRYWYTDINCHFYGSIIFDHINNKITEAEWLWSHRFVGIIVMVSDCGAQSLVALWGVSLYLVERHRECCFPFHVIMKKCFSENLFDLRVIFC